MKNKPRKKRIVEYSKRSYDGKTLQWTWMTDVELGITKYRDSKRFPHLADNGRWVITKIYEGDDILDG
tara:strand:+ start:70 stop:273 length:204 start_codon:yes stop_codon:yes gene_type:complete